MENGADISRVISAIMQNPQLISEIKSLVERGADEEMASSAEPEEYVQTAENREVSDTPAAVYLPGDNKTPPTDDSGRKRRRELMRALKPYVSKERSQAIDSMLSIIEVFNIIREK